MEKFSRKFALEKVSHHVLPITTGDFGELPGKESLKNASKAKICLGGVKKNRKNRGNSGFF